MRLLEPRRSDFCRSTTHRRGAADGDARLRAGRLSVHDAGPAFGPEQPVGRPRPHLDTVHLNITAQSGPGELVGNLLCAIANLLNGGLPLNTVLGQIAALLNQLLAILG